MAERAKVTFAFNLAGIGATETYISASGDPGVLSANIQALIRARNELLFENILWAGMRVSNPDLKRRGSFYPPGLHQLYADTPPALVPASGNRTAEQSPTFRPDQARSCMQIRVRFDTDRRVTRYLFGIPDGVLTHEPGGLQPAGAIGWQQDFNAFVQRLIADGWCIRALVRARNDPNQPDPNVFPILNWVSAAGPPQRMGFVIPTTPALTLGRDRFVKIYNTRRRGTDKTSYNGRYFVQQVVPNTQDQTTAYYLRGTEDGEPESVKLPGQVQVLSYTYFPILGFQPIRVGIHKRGNVLGVPHGRRQNRVSLDP